MVIKKNFFFWVGNLITSEDYKHHLKEDYLFFYYSNTLLCFFNYFSLYPYLVNRFDEAFNTSSVFLRQIKGVNFITINSMAMHGDDCYFCKSAEIRINELSRKLFIFNP